MAKEKENIPFFTFLEDKLGRTQKSAKEKLDEYLGGYKATDYECISVVFTIGNYWYVRTTLNSYSSYNKLKRSIVEFLFNKEKNPNSSVPGLLKSFLKDDPRLARNGKRRVWVFNHKEYGSKLPGIVAQLLIKERFVDEKYSVMKAFHEGKFKHTGAHPLYLEKLTNVVGESVKANAWVESPQQYRLNFQEFPAVALKKMVTLPKLKQKAVKVEKPTKAVKPAKAK